MSYDPKFGTQLRTMENVFADLQDTAARLRDNFISKGFSEDAAEQMVAESWKTWMTGGQP